MHINSNTKIATLIKQHPDALETIISISPRFEKLRNPVLRKLMAGRASISMASKMSGCSIQTFYEKLKPLGFEMDGITPKLTEEKKTVPDFMSTMQNHQLVELDVRPVIASGKDPLDIITQKIKTIKAGQVLKIINSFEPIPLMMLLEKQGFEVFSDTINDDLVETYFYKKNDIPANFSEPKKSFANGWEQVIEKFTHKMQTIDVRQMEMPQPMITILEALDKLPDDNALFVYHKRIPVFLLPELAERKFDYRIKEIGEGEVQLIIFKDENV